MASLSQQLKNIEKQLKAKIKNSLENDVFEKVQDVMQKHIMQDVYQAYIPEYYIRTYQLILDETIDGTMINDNTLVVRNTRHEDDRDIVRVIEYGKGYQWGYKRNLDEEIGPRPFVENTRQDLRSNKQHINAMRTGLKRQNVDVVG